MNASLRQLDGNEVALCSATGQKERMHLEDTSEPETEVAKDGERESEREREGEAERARLTRVVEGRRERECRERERD